MTIADYEDATEIRHIEAGFFAALGRFLAARKRRHAERRTIIELSRLDAHLLRDIGIDPRDVSDALNGRQSSALFEPIRRYDHE